MFPFQNRTHRFTDLMLYCLSTVSLRMLILKYHMFTALNLLCGNFMETFQLYKTGFMWYKVVRADQWWAVMDTAVERRIRKRRQIF